MGNCNKKFNKSEIKYDNDFDFQSNDTIPNTAKKFSLDGFETDARVVRIIDGDSIEVIFRFKGNYNMWKCRIAGINAPELRGGTEKSKENAILAKNILEDKILGEIIQIYCKDFDPFGRLFILIDYNGEDIGEYLVKLGYATTYLID